MVVVSRLSVSFGATPVLDGLDLTAYAGTVTCVTGENGAGKSTLLRCLAGLQAPTSGSVRVFGTAPGRSTSFWRKVATSVEDPAWYYGLTVREHVELVRLANGADPTDGRIDELFATLGMSELADSVPATLSSGQRQRFLLSAVLARPSRLLLLDEPEQRLDAEIKPVVAELLAAYVRQGGTIIMASHDASFASAVGGEVVPLRRAWAGSTPV